MRARVFLFITVHGFQFTVHGFYLMQLVNSCSIFGVDFISRISSFLSHPYQKKS